MSEQFLRLPQVTERVGLGKSSIWAMVDAREFPEPRQIGKRAVAWLGSEVDEWMRSRPKASEKRGDGRI